MGHFIKTIIAGVFLSVLCMAIPGFVHKAGAQQAMPSDEQIGSTLDTFKGMSPAERQQILNAAMDNFKNMSPEERQQLIEEATQRVKALSESQKKAYESQWQTALSPEQKQMLLQKMQEQGVFVSGTPQPAAALPAPAPTPASAPAQNTAAGVMQQINSLPPDQRQKLIEAIKGGAK